MRETKMPKVTMIVDLQYGSTGKGAIAAYIGVNEQPDVVISANMPNAGHTAYDSWGAKFVHKVLPSAIFHNPTIVGIGPGAVFDPNRLLQEVTFARSKGHLKQTGIMIHENAIPLQDIDRMSEEGGPMSKVASTAQGSAAAMIRKIHRDPGAPTIIRDVAEVCEILSYHEIMVIPNRTWITLMSEAEHILAEGAQGYSLGINQRFYPYCTSRDCTPARFMSDMALPWIYLNRVIGSCRTFPIRVGNTGKGTSGGHYDDQCELSWDDIGVEPEKTTVTGRVRRVFSWSDEQFKEALRETRPTEVFINFMNYMLGSDRPEFLMRVGKMARAHGARVNYLGYGPKIGDIEEVFGEL
jgi:adenylosuccinate synthase